MLLPCVGLLEPSEVLKPALLDSRCAGSPSFGDVEMHCTRNSAFVLVRSRAQIQRMLHHPPIPRHGWTIMQPTCWYAPLHYPRTFICPLVLQGGDTLCGG